MRQIVIPSTVTSIANQAFKDCTSLELVCFSGTKDQWRRIAIGDENECLTGAKIIFGLSRKIVKGDVTGDDSADSLDAVFILKFDAGLVADADEAQIYAADVNKDGSVDTLDATLVLKYDAGLFEIEE